MTRQRIWHITVWCALIGMLFSLVPANLSAKPADIRERQDQNGQVNRLDQVTQAVYALPEPLTDGLSTTEMTSRQPAAALEPQPTVDLAPQSKSAILMDAASGKILFQKNIHEKLAPASITKIMTMLLVMEAIENKQLGWDDKLVTSEYAASMGGSQIYLEPGEEMTVRDLMKGVAMASANDATVVLAEKIAGTEEMFVKMMNDKARELGMKNTHFVNTNGLPARDHYTTAHDIAVMSRALLKYEEITNYTKVYEDYLRKNTDKPFWLVNTNKLVRFYKGVDGLKTGFTSEAKYCLSATAKRDQLRVIAVVLGAPSSKVRNAEVSRMLDYAFSQYTNYPVVKKGDVLGTVKVEKGKTSSFVLKATKPYNVLMKKGDAAKGIRHKVYLRPLQAPVHKGQKIGELVVTGPKGTIAKFDLTSPVDIGKAGWWQLFKRSMSSAFR